MKRHFLLTLLLLGAAISVSAQYWSDVTGTCIKNPNYDNNNGDGWTWKCDSKVDWTYGCMEFFNGTWNVWQEITLPAGKYKLSVQGYYRVGDNSEAAVNNYKNGKENITCLFYAGEKKQKLKSVYSEPTKDWYNGAWSYAWWGGDYYPNSMESGQYMFQKGAYLNEMEFESDGKPIKIGIVNETKKSSNWTLFDNWKIERAITDIAPISKESAVINEIMAANSDMFVSPSFNYSSWIELYNPSDDKVILDDCYISDDETNLSKFRLPKGSGLLPAHGHCVVWFDDHLEKKDSEVYGKLDCDGGTVYLSAPDGTLLASQTYPAAISRASYARKQDGGNEWGWTAEPTPGKSNDNSVFATVRLAEPVVQTVNQMFSRSVSFKVEIPDGQTLRYTTDGTTPTMENGQTSADGQFKFTQNTTLRVRLFKDGYLPSPVVTRSYLRKDKAYYLPVISITTNSDNLYSNQLGVFVRGVNGRKGNGQDTPCNWNMDWDRPVNFEYMTSSGELLLSQEVNLSRCGGWSRAWEPYSYKLKASKVYEGQNFLPYEFFPEKPYLKHKSLQIRNGGNDNNARFKDPALQEIIRTSGINVEGQAYNPVHQFINGEYKGLINMREPNNKHHAYAHYGWDNEEIDQFEISPDSGYAQMEGTKDAIDRLLSLSANAELPEVYEEIKTLIDIDEAINYLAIELWLGGDDWPHNNFKGYRNRNNGKFRFVLFDLDFAFAKTSDVFTFFENGQRHTGNEIYDTGKKLTWDNPLVKIFIGLMKNADFCKQFIDTYCLVGGSVFEPTRAKAIIDNLAARIKQAQQFEGISNNTANDLKNKLSNRNSSMVNALKNYSNASKNAFNLNNRTRQQVKLSSSLGEFGEIYVNNLPVPLNSFNGYLFAPVTFKASVPAGYRFVGWKKTDGTIVSEDLEYEMPSGTVSLTATFEKLTGDGLTHAIPAPVRVNELSASNSVFVNDYFKKNDWVELYNLTDQDYDVAGAYLSDNIKKPTKYRIPENGIVKTVVPAHGYLVIWCDKLEDLTDLHTSFKLSSDAESIVMLTAADETWSDKLEYPTHSGNQSVGRYPDGADDVYVMNVPSIVSRNKIDSNALYYNAQQAESTGIDNIDKDCSLALHYSNGEIVLKSDDAEWINLTVYSADGIMQLYTTAVCHSGRATVPFRMARGIYIVKAEDCNGRTVSAKLRR